MSRNVRRPHRDDLLISGAGLVGGLTLWLLGLHGGPPLLGLPGHLTVVALVTVSAAESLRRTAPGAALAIGTLALTLDMLTGTLLPTVLMFTDLVYAAVLYGRPATARRVRHAAVLVTVLIGTAAPIALQDPAGVLLGLGAALITTTPAETAALIRRHQEAADAARLRADRTALLAELDRSQAITAERARMARELHDLVANHLSAIALHVTAVQSLRDPGATERALDVIRTNSVQGLAEMRRLIDLLRKEDGGLDTGGDATLDRLDGMLDQARANGAAGGLRFELRDRRASGERLPAPVEFTAYRIVQEALSNAVKHATPGEVTVRLDRDRPAGGPPGALTVEVTSPYGGPLEPRAPGTGTGLIGMRERVLLLDGVFEAGATRPAPPGGAALWRVRATLPVPETSKRPPRRGTPVIR